MQDLIDSDILSIIDIYSNNNSTPEIWNDIKDHWRLIQSKITKGKICPWCGKLYKNHFRSHILYHNKTFRDYIIIRYNLLEFPKCPICNKDCGINIHDLRILNTCGSSYCMHSLSNYTRVKLGNHNFAYNGNPDHDKEMNSKLYKWAWNRIKSGNNILAYNNDPDHNKKVLEFHRNKLKLRDNIRYSGWHSRPENLLAEVLSKLSIYYIREMELFNQKYRVDYYLPDYNKILECDGMFKWTNGILNKYYIDRAREIEILTGIDVINIPSNNIYYYNKNPRLLWNIIKYPKYKLINI